jgi:hypothetical protein
MVENATGIDKEVMVFGMRKEILTDDNKPDAPDKENR